MSILKHTRALLTAAATAALAATGIAVGAAPANAAPANAWDQLAQCESSGNWHINTGNGYYGGLQFNLGTWRAHGGSGNPASASRTTQIRIAERVLATQGWGAWPACSARLGLHGGVASSASTVTHHAAKKVHHTTHVALSGKVHVVRAGETVGKIAAAYHVHGGWARLAHANHLANPNLIFVGQRLHLPA